MADGFSWWKYPVIRPASGQGMSNRVRTYRREDHPDSYVVSRMTAFQDPYDLRVLDEVEVLDLLRGVDFTPDVLAVTPHSPLSRTLIVTYLGRLSDEPPPRHLTRETVRDFALRNLSAVAGTDWSAPGLRSAYRAALEHQRANIEAMCEQVPGSSVIPLELNGHPPTMEAAAAAQVIRSARYAERRYGVDGLRSFGLLPADRIAQEWDRFYTPPDRGAEPSRLVHRDARLDNLTLRSARTLDPTDPPERLVGLIDWELAGFMTPRSGLLHELAVMDRHFRSPVELERLLAASPEHANALRREIAQSAYNDVLRGHETVDGKRRLPASAVTATTELFRVAFGLDRWDLRPHARQRETERMAAELSGRRAAYADWPKSHGSQVAPYPARPLAVRAPARRPAHAPAGPGRSAETVTVIDAVLHTAHKPTKASPITASETNRSAAAVRPAVVARDTAGHRYLPRRGR
ncbi:aminoglycoside phosphotransferase family protein [Marinitenerispora sediminis]|nr:aminoglycoside phosphotransferase family protein [Marinitenerispora sediminis]